MPPRDVRMYLADARDACDLILSCTQQRSMEQYLQDRIVRAAVERQFEIIGEALKKIVEIEPGLSLRFPEAKESVKFRNFLSHAYHLVDHETVWSIIQTDIVPLRRQLHAVLTERSTGKN